MSVTIASFETTLRSFAAMNFFLDSHYGVAMWFQCKVSLSGESQGTVCILGTVSACVRRSTNTELNHTFLLSSSVKVVYTCLN